MPRLRSKLLATIVPLVLVLPVSAQQPPPEDETSPAILRFVRERLAGSEGLRPADGVEVRETRFFRGTLRVSGTVRSADQLGKVRRTIDALRGDIESDFDVRVMNIDYSGLTVVAGGKTAEPERLKAMPSESPQPQSPPPEPGPEVWEESFDFLPPPPPPPAKERRRHHWRKKNEEAEPYGTPPPWVPLEGAGWSDPWTDGWMGGDDGPNAFDPYCAQKHHHWWRKRQSKDP
jgi:hypothetical protein